ncbi:MAG: CRISPR-associated ring nuclease Csm6 [Defluviicoccus sp.]|nr:CRISPR-associated ring nuclease Csm6 [Defluviicoccus sp.]MDG4608964.1 CRISPR-associated ring nuclease Csm6 [Defluviicoccus sp.]
MTNALVTVLGLSPAVITETLCALAHRESDGRPDPFFADEVHILTTGRGISQVETRLRGEGGGLARVCQELGRADQPPSLIVEPIRGADGRVLDDIRGEADNSALGDATVRLIGRLTERDDVRLHASMAGGRKTMSFFMGYVMSLFGRPEDELSHVLLHDERYEFCRDFWCPTQVSRPLAYVDRESGETVKLDARDARVDLTPIPFVPLRYLLRADDLASLRVGTYAGLVQRIRDIVGVPLAVTLVDARRQILVSGRAPIELTPQSYAMYRLMAMAASDARPGAGPDGSGPAHCGWLTVHDLRLPDDPMVEAFVRVYERLRDPGGKVPPPFAAKLQPTDTDPWPAVKVFSQIRANLERELESKVPDRLLLERLRFGKGEGTGGQPNRFGLRLPPEQIQIIEG